MPAAGGSQDGASHAWIPDGRHGHMVSHSPRACWVSGAASFGVSRPRGGGLQDWAGPGPTRRLHGAVKGIWEGRDLGPGNLNLQLPPGSWWVSGRGVSCLDPGQLPWAHGEPFPGSQCAIGARLRLLAAWLGSSGDFVL